MACYHSKRVPQSLGYCKFAKAQFHINILTSNPGYFYLSLYTVQLKKKKLSEVIMHWISHRINTRKNDWVNVCHFVILHGDTCFVLCYALNLTIKRNLENINSVQTRLKEQNQRQALKFSLPCEWDQRS